MMDQALDLWLDCSHTMRQDCEQHVLWIKIQNAIENCKIHIALLICFKHFLHSPWKSKELEWIKRHLMGREYLSF